MSLTDDKTDEVLDRDHAERPEPVSWHDLDAFMIGDEDDITEPQTGDLAHVERLLRGIAWRERELAKARDFVQAQKDQLAEWIDEQERKFSTDHHRLVLEQYHRARLAEDDRARTIKLPSGTLSARAGQPRWEIDEATFVPWALANRGDHLLRVKHEPDRTEIKKALTVEGGNAISADGEVVPGVSVEPAETKFTVKAGDG